MIIGLRPHHLHLQKHPKLSVKPAISTVLWVIMFQRRPIASMYFPPFLVVTLMRTFKVLVETMALTDMKIRNAKPEAKQYKPSAGLGLYLVVSPKGGKCTGEFVIALVGNKKNCLIDTSPTIMRCTNNGFSFRSGLCFPKKQL